MRKQDSSKTLTTQQAEMRKRLQAKQRKAVRRPKVKRKAKAPPQPKAKPKQQRSKAAPKPKARPLPVLAAPLSACPPSSENAPLEVEVFSGPIPWWGGGTPPWERFPGVTIPIEAYWHPLKTRYIATPEDRDRAGYWIDDITGDEIEDWAGEDAGVWFSHGGRYYFDRAKAQEAASFFPDYLTHSKGEFAGKPFDLEPWEELLIILPVFGWVHSDSGLRRFRKVYIEIPKKNGKSKLCAGLGLFMTLRDNEPGAEVFCAAADREQAAIVFEEARTMVQDNDELQQECTVLRRIIENEATRSIFRVLSSDAATKHGPNIHCLIFDELHAQKERELFETLEKGIAARRQPLIFMITTSGNDTESICYEQHEYAESVLKTTLLGEPTDEAFLPVLFNLPRDANWRDLEVLRKVNPSLGVTVKEAYLLGEILAADRDPRKQNAFKQLHGNIWTQQKNLWIPIDQWDACKREIDLESLKGLPVAGGLDLSSKIDLTAFVLAFKHREAQAIEVVLEPEKEIVGTRGQVVPARKLNLNFSMTLIPFFFMPEESLTERKTKDRFGYDICATKGLIDLTPGVMVDYDRIYDTIKEQDKIWKLKGGEIGYDPYNATHLCGHLAKDGFKMIEIPQTISHLTEASKVFEAMVKAGRIRHSGHRVLRWCAENVGYDEDKAGNIKPVKVSAMKRMDGIIASVLALSRLLAMPDKQPGSLGGWVRRG